MNEIFKLCVFFFFPLQLIGAAVLDVSIEMDEKIKTGVTEFIQMIQRRYPQTDIFVACEAMPQDAAHCVFVATENFGKYVQFLGTVQGDNKIYAYGLTIHKESKNLILSNLQFALRHRLLRVAKTLSVIATRELMIRGHTFDDTEDGRAKYILRLLHQELDNIECLLTGRVTGKNRGIGKDDGVMSLGWSASGFGMLMDRTAGIRPKRVFAQVCEPAKFARFQ